MAKENLLGAAPEYDSESAYQPPTARGDTAGAAAQTQERQQKRNLHMSRRDSPGAEEKPGTDSATEGAKEEKPTFEFWLLLGLAVLILTGIAWLIGLLVAPFGIAINYMVVGALWLWAKMKRLKPPNFGSAAKIAKGAGKENPVSGAAEAVPGSDLMYIFAGGITPMFYLVALYLNNR